MMYKVLIVDDHPMIAESLSSLCNMIKEIENTSCVHSVDQLQSMDISTYDLFIIDIELGLDDGRSWINKIKSIDHKKPILVFSSHQHAAVIKSAFKAGADAYLLKTTPPEEIINCIQCLIRGETFMNQEVQTILNQNLMGKTQERNAFFPELTKREKEVLQLILQEMTSKEIALHLHLSEHTIEGHRSSLFQKFQVRNIAGLVKKALDSGMV